MPDLTNQIYSYKHICKIDRTPQILLKLYVGNWIKCCFVQNSITLCPLTQRWSQSRKHWSRSWTTILFALTLVCAIKKPFGWKSIITSARWQTNHCLPLIYGTNPRMSRYCSMNGNSTYRLRKTAPRASSRTPWCEPKEEDEGKLIDIGWLVTKLVIRTQFG